MYPKLLHIYGPLYIQSYGLMIVVGLIVFAWFVLHNPRREKLVTKEQFFSIMSWGILSALFGGHLLYVLAEERSLEAFVRPEGFSILGSIVGVFTFLPFYLRAHRIPILPFLDLITTYAPIIQAFGRLGCFLAGCCYGSACSLPWAITYTNTEVEAPLYTALHPSQLYSATLLFGIALLLGGWLQYRFKKSGQIIGLYLMLVSAERFLTDFFRADHQAPLSSYQYISLGMFCIATLFFMARSKNNVPR